MRWARRNARAQRTGSLGKGRLQELDRAWNGSRPEAGNSRSADVPTWTLGMSASESSASTQTTDRSATVTISVDGSTAVPTAIPRCRITPARGAVTVTRRRGSPDLSIDAISASVMPSTSSRERAPSATALRGPVVAAARRAARYSVWEAKSSCKDPGNGLSLPDDLAGGVHVQALDPPGHARVHMRDARLVGHHGGDGREWAG